MENQPQFDIDIDYKCIRHTLNLKVLAGMFVPVTGQFANKRTHGQSSCGLVNSWTSNLGKAFLYEICSK